MFEALTWYENEVVPDGGVPETAPVRGVGSSHAGAPEASANVGAGTAPGAEAEASYKPPAFSELDRNRYRSGTDGAGASTERVKACVAWGPTPFWL